MANIIITGTSRGIGYELARLFADEGHRVLALSRSDKSLLSLGHPNITAFPFDIAAPSDLLRLKVLLDTEWEVVDVLVHNAGKLVNKPFLETTTQELEEVYKVNLFGVVALSQLVLPKMKKKGHVVSISSMGGIQGSAKFPGLSAYSSSKGAVITLTELLAEEFKETGPSFNVLALGAVQTEMLEEAFPGYQAPCTALEMASYIKEFALSGHRLFNGKVLQVSSSTP